MSPPGPGAVALASQFESDPEIAALFASPPAPEEVAALVADLGLAVPEAFYSLFRLCNGSVGSEALYDARSVLADDGLVLHSLAEIRKWKQFWDQLAHSYAALDAADRQPVFHHGFWNTAWLPIAMTILDDVYALATVPCFGGPAFQVVRFNVKGDAHWVLVSESLDQFLGLLATVLARRERSLRTWTLSQLAPGARWIELMPATPERFERTGEPLSDHAYPDSISRAPSLAALVAAAATARQIPAAPIIDAIVAAARAALPSIFGEQRRLEVDYDEETGELRLYCIVVVVDVVQHRGMELTLGDASTVFGPCTIADEIMVQVFFRLEEDSQAQGLAKEYGQVLQWDAAWTARLDSWRAAVRDIVADGLRTP